MMLCVSTSWAKPKNADGKKAAPAAVKVMVVGLPHNVSSNYYPISMISEETGIPTDSVVATYNNAIAQNIVANNKDASVEFFIPTDHAEMQMVTDKIALKGDNAEQKMADLSEVAPQDFDRLLAQNDADYVLFLNQHYLKWQEKPMQTVFHITSYSLFDRDRQEVAHGNNNFTSINLESKDKLQKDARKSSSKIASAVVKNLER